MTNRTAAITLVVMIALSVLVGTILYPRLPDQIPSHWNANGEVDATTSRLKGVTQLPLVAASMALLMWFVPKIDPKRANWELFREYYNALIVLLVGFMLYIYALTLFWSLDIRFSIGRAIAPALGVLFFYLGSVMGRIKQNWFFGIRTPWTLSSARVWDKTHQRGGQVFKLAALIALAGVLLPENLIFFSVLVPILLAAGYTMLYSYLEYRREESRPQ